MYQRMPAMICGCFLLAFSQAYADDDPPPVTYSIGIREVPNSQLYVFDAIQQGGTACLSFINQSRLTAFRVVFALSGIDASGNDLQDNYLTMDGQFAPGDVLADKCGTSYLGNTYVPPFASTQTPIADVAMPIEVDYSDGTSWNAGPLVMGHVLTSDNSDITITRAYAWQPKGECVDFTNSGTRPIHHVRFNFAHIQSGGAHTADGWIDVNGTYNPGAAASYVCHGVKGMVLPAIGSAPGSPAAAMFLNSQATALVASVGTIDYADGTSWHASGKPATPAPMPASSDVHYDTWWPATSRFAIPIVSDAASTVEITDAFVWANDGQSACVHYVNQSQVPTTHVRIRISATAEGGHHVADDVLEVYTKGYTAGSYHDQCIEYPYSPGPLPDLLGFGPPPSGPAPPRLSLFLPVQWSNDQTPLQLIYSGVSVTLSVRVDEVDFANGTSWHA